MKSDENHLVSKRLLEYDVVVIGGGPAGLVTATELTAAGAHVALVDESSVLGGQYYKRRQGAILEQFGDYRKKGSELVALAENGGTSILTSRVVWGISKSGELLTSGTACADHVRIRATAVVIATGAYEHSIPFPGWEMPGVVTPGHAHHLAMADRVPVGERVLVAGSGPFLLPVACALLDVGVDVVAIVESGRPYRLTLGSMRALRYPGALVELAGYVKTLVKHRVKLLQGAYVSSAAGTHLVQTVDVVGRNGATRRFEVDALAVAHGFRPSTELCDLYGLTTVEDPVSGALVPAADEFGRTSERGIYVAGETRGIAGNIAARSEGQLVSDAIRVQLGLTERPLRARKQSLRLARRMRNFSVLATKIYKSTAQDSTLYEFPSETIVCRCEAVTAGEIRATAALGGADRHSTKAETRAGMGPCQGRECGVTVGKLLQQCGVDRPIGETHARMPVKPISINGLLPTKLKDR